MTWSFTAKDLPQPHGALEVAELLFALSRRHALPFSVVAVRAATHRAQEPSDRRARTPLEDAIAVELRQTDVLARWGEGGRWLVFCPSTAAQGAKELSLRILARTGGPVFAVGTASFREQAHTLPELIERAWEALAATHGDDGGSGRPGEPVSPVPRAGFGVLLPSRRRRLGKRLKRGFDVTAVLAAAPFWAPLALAITLAIKLSDPQAPVLFRQMRTGEGGRRFAMLKFRTMVPDAEARKSELAHLNQRDWPDFKIENDPRVTSLGRILRKTSLDELPQLFNVLRGEMSLVGPRPTSFPPETYEAWHTARLDMPPGVTGLWQVEGRGRADFDERLRLDHEYARRRSLLYDLRLLARTVPVVLTTRGGH